MQARIALIASAVLLAACGGGGGGSGGGGGGGGASNQPPAFTSAASASVAENTAAAFYTAAASDPDGDVLTFSVSGGADAARFRIDAQTGALSFLAPPDFELAGDSNADNTYAVTLAVTDGTVSVSHNLSVNVSDLSGPVAVRRVVAGLAAPLFLAPAAGPNVFVVERGGIIRLLDASTGQLAPDVFLNVSGQIATNGEHGLLGFAPAPDFATSGVVYIQMSNTAGNTEVRRYRTLAGDPTRADPASADIILAVDQPATSHNGGWIGFGPDGFLYIALGDGGGSGDPFGNGQDPDTLLGAILRIDPSGDDFPGDGSRDYRIPASNPFAGAAGADEIWVWGLRNPFRASFDRDSGDLLVGDVGQNAIEEIDLVRPSDPGANYGWNLYEGAQAYPPGSTPAPTAGLTFPVAQYGHGSGPLQGNSVTGGYVYRGPIASLRGTYFFADFINQRIWSLPASSLVQGTTLSSSAFTDRTAAFAPDLGAIGGVVSFGEDARGNVFILDIDGEIFVITEDD